MKRNVPLIIGNWKCNPATKHEAEALASATNTLTKRANAYVGIAPTSLHVASVARKLARSSLVVGAQTLGVDGLGAHTGSIAAEQLVDAGLEFVIIGHSERRAAGESDADVRRQLDAAVQHKLTPIICFGEQKRDTKGQFYKTIEAQLKAVFADLPAAKAKKVVLAYEPIWAIGTGKTASARDVADMRAFIIKSLSSQYDEKVAAGIRLLYGGSVKPHNAAELHADGGMGGFLVGGASLMADDFALIVNAVV